MRRKKITRALKNESLKKVIYLFTFDEMKTPF